MSYIDDWLAEETRLVEETQKLLLGWSADLVEALDDAAGLHKTFLHAYHPSDVDDNLELKECGRLLGARDGNELYDVAYSEDIAEGKREIVQRARAAIDRSQGRVYRGILYSLSARAYQWAVGDLHRRRVTAVLGYQRIQAEALSTAMLILEDPAIGEEWFGIKTDENGRRFFRKHQRRLYELMRRFALSDVYDVGSAVSLHARAATVAHGFESRISTERGRRVHELVLVSDEYDPDLQHIFLSHVLRLLQTQQRIFTMARFALPEVTDPVLLDSRLPRYSALVDDLFGAVRGFESHPHRVFTLGNEGEHDER